MLMMLVCIFSGRFLFCWFVAAADGCAVLEELIGELTCSWRLFEDSSRLSRRTFSRQRQVISLDELKVCVCVAQAFILDSLEHRVPTRLPASAPHHVSVSVTERFQASGHIRYEQ